MSRPEIIKQLKQKNSQLNNSDFVFIIDTFCETIRNALKNGRNIDLRGFGTFYIHQKKENYSARNPKTGELIYVPEKNKIRFNPGKKLKKLINK